jgi:hypothetical protein
MMEPLVNEHLKKLLGAHRPPCLSLYQLTHRHHPDNQQDPIRYGNLLKTLEESLQQKYATREVAQLLAPFRSLADDAAFWNHTLDGLAVLGAADTFEVFKVQRPVVELAIVADSFHTRPLMRILQSADCYQVLSLSQHGIRLYEGNRDTLDEIELAKGVPRTITDALGDELSEPRLTVSSYGTGPGGPGGAGGAATMRHGHGGKKDEIDLDRERYFRAVDHSVLKHHSRPTALPLILAALPEHHALFHGVSRNPFLAAEGIRINPDALSIDQLREKAWRAVEPLYHARVAQFIEEFGSARPRNLAAGDLSDIAVATVSGRVATLLVEADRQIAGRLNAASGAVAHDDSADPDVDDLLDDIAESVLRKGGQVLIVPAEKMPTDTGVAALYRF